MSWSFKLIRHYVLTGRVALAVRMDDSIIDFYLDLDKLLKPK